MPKLFSILFGALFTCAVAWAMGRILLSRLRLKLYREEEHLLGFVAGSVLLGLAMFALGTVQAFYDGVFLAVGAAVLLYAWRSGALRGAKAALPPLPQFWKRLFLFVYVPYAIYAVVWALAPEHSPDGASYHLGVMDKFYRGHGFFPMPDHMYAHLSQGVDLLFLHAYAFGRHSAAAFTHCIFLLTLPLMIVAFGRRYGLPGPGVAAALLVFASPVAAIDGASAYIDVALTAILFALFYVAEIQRDKPAIQGAVLLGILAGGAYAAKYTAIVALPMALLMLFLALRRAKAPVLKPLIACAAAATVLILPWVLRNWIQYWNPLSPLFNAWFPNPFITISFEQDYTTWLKMYPGVESYWRLPMMVAVRGEALSGHLGPIFLLTPLALFAARFALGRRILLAALVYASTYPLNIGTRFLLPALPLLSLALAMAVPARAATPVLALALLFHAVTGAPPVINRLHPSFSWHIPNLPWRAALGLESREAYLARVSPEYRIARMVQSETPAGATVFTLAGLAEAYTDRTIIVDYQSAKGERLRDRLYVATDPNFQGVRRLEYRFPRRKLRQVRVVQTAPGGTRDLWAMTEMRILDGDREIPSSSAWKLRGSDAPWRLHEAFDGNPVTRWRAWRWLRPGMYVSVEFPGLEQVDAVWLETSPDHHAARLQVEGVDESGRWTVLAGEPKIISLAPPLGLRCLATRELLREGVGYLVVPEGNPYAKDFETKADLWGITEAGAASDMRLYRLEQECLTSFSVSTGDSPPQQR